MKLYHATSLDDIAKQFRAMAKSAEKVMNASIERGKRDRFSGEVIAWNAAADMLENMELATSDDPSHDMPLEI